MASQAAASAAQTFLRNDPYHVFNFFVEIEGIFAGGFSECSGLQVEAETFAYREGGVNDFEHTFVGPVKSGPLVLKRGLTLVDSLWLWFRETSRGNIVRKNGTIYLLNKMHIPVVWWNFKEAVPIKWTGPEFNANSNDVAFTSVELAHRGLSQPQTERLKAIFNQGTAGALAVAGGISRTI
ncbi:MAG TPA: phage tail protein [Pyrinomonadaceae bacterium]|nr:phage tail protein [Pyrinomonadaceae bacterium]